MTFDFTLHCIAICSIFLASCAAEKCPPSPPVTQTIDSNAIKGPWILAANKPEFDEKCKNLTFSKEGSNFRLHEELFMSTDNWKREENIYEITSRIGDSYMFLYNKATETTVKLFLVDGVYTNYILFYSCDDSTGTPSEAWEIWTRGFEYKSADLPQKITRTLSELNLKPSDFTYRTANDCVH